MIEFDLPDLSLDDNIKFSAWIEFCALFGESGSVSKTDLFDLLRDAGHFTDVVDPEEFGEGIWDNLRAEGKTRKGSGFPFELDGRSVIRCTEHWRSVPSLSLLLIADVGRHYGQHRDCFAPDSQEARLFEKIVEAAESSLLRGAAVRFGWPRDRDWPQSIEERVKHLADRLHIAAETLEGKLESSDRDRGLDVVARLGLGDESGGTLYVLTQCATGKHYKQKRGEPTFTRWNNLLQWDSPMIRAVAVPWRLDDSFDYHHAYRHFDALILDRSRLLMGEPDKVLGNAMKDEILSWCETRIGLFPRLS